MPSYVTLVFEHDPEAQQFIERVSQYARLPANWWARGMVTIVPQDRIATYTLQCQQCI